jgi:hypothetical protein
VSMCLSVLLEDVEGRMGGMFADSWTLVMPNPRVGFVGTPRIAGVAMQWRPQMVQRTFKVHIWCWRRRSCATGPLPPNSNVSGKKRLPFLIVSIPQRKLGKILTFGTSIPPHSDACRAEIVRWVSESKRPFKIVKDRRFQTLMKTGRPEYHIPSPETVSRDVRNVFVNARKHIAKMLQVSDARFFETKKKLTSRARRNTTVL